MNWLDRAENRFGHLAIPGLPRVVAALNLLVYVLYKLDPHYLAALSLNPALVMKGEVWRLVTFLFIPYFGWFPDWFEIILYVLSILFIGSGLERAMGAFKLTLYYAIGALGIIISGFAFGGWFGNPMLNVSLLFAFARFYPDAVIYIMYIIPAKVKWLAWGMAAFLLYSFVTGPGEFRIALTVAFLNYWLFFGAEILRDIRERRTVAARRDRFQSQVQDKPGESLHECAVCHRTELTAPELDFRVARDGQEYCREHLPKPAS